MKITWKGGVVTKQCRIRLFFVVFFLLCVCIVHMHIICEYPKSVYDEFVYIYIA